MLSLAVLFIVSKTVLAVALPGIKVYSWNRGKCSLARGAWYESLMIIMSGEL